jgi:Family of unknown function (DUF6600)
MKRTLLAFMTLIGLSAAAPLLKADVSVDFFYNNLAGGSWIEVGDYGYCWQPDVAVNEPDWRPYSDGYWAYTDEGWTWISYEDFGWATYHYGRWAHLSDAGWVWVPGRDQDLEWGPAWVSWRTGGDYIGWAPLPPTGERVYEGRDINGHVDIDFDIGPAYYNFVETRYIGEPVLRERIFAPTQNITYINQTVNVTNITYKNKVVYNYGPDINVINQRSSRPIQRLTIQRNNNADFGAVARSGGLKTTVQGQSLVVAAPSHIARSNRQVAPPAVKTKVAKANLDTGWAGVGDARAKEQFKEKLRSEDPTKIPQGAGAAATGAGTNAQVGGLPAGASPAASAAGGMNAGSRHGGRNDRNQGAATAASVAPAATASPAQTGVPGSTDANAGLEGGRGGKHQNRQAELNATGSATSASPAAESAVAGSTYQGAGQDGGKHNRRYENAPTPTQGQIQGQSPAGADQSQGQGGRRERRLEGQGVLAPNGATSSDAQGQRAGGGVVRGPAQGQGVTGQPAGGSTTEPGQPEGQGRHQGGKKKQGEASPVPSPQ